MSFFEKSKTSNTFWTPCKPEDLVLACCLNDTIRLRMISEKTAALFTVEQDGSLKPLIKISHETLYKLKNLHYIQILEDKETIIISQIGQNRQVNLPGAAKILSAIALIAFESKEISLTLPSFIEEWINTKMKKETKPTPTPIHHTETF